MPSRRIESLLRAAKLGLIYMSSRERTAADYYIASLEVSLSTNGLKRTPKHAVAQKGGANSPFGKRRCGETPSGIHIGYCRVRAFETSDAASRGGVYSLQREQS